MVRHQFPSFSLFSYLFCTCASDKDRIKLVNSSWYEIISQKHAVLRISAFTKEYDFKKITHFFSLFPSSIFLRRQRDKMSYSFPRSREELNNFLKFKRIEWTLYDINVYLNERTWLRRSVAVFLIIYYQQSR